MSMMAEFKKFVTRGNVVDLAVGVIIGAAFTAIVSSLVTDIIMPPLGLILGHIDFSNLFINLTGPHADTLDEAKHVGAATLNYGVFLNNVVRFLITAFAVFLLVRQMNRIVHKNEAAAPTPAQELLLAEIRDLLKKQVDGKAS